MVKQTRLRMSMGFHSSSLLVVKQGAEDDDRRIDRAWHGVWLGRRDQSVHVRGDKPQIRMFCEVMVDLFLQDRRRRFARLQLVQHHFENLCFHRNDAPPAASGLMAEGQILFDAIHVGCSDKRGFAQGATAFRTFALEQMPAARAAAQHLAGAGDFEAFGY
jgi:hypothetical protein